MKNEMDILKCWFIARQKRIFC